MQVSQDRSSQVRDIVTGSIGAGMVAVALEGIDIRSGVRAAVESFGQAPGRRALGAGLLIAGSVAAGGGALMLTEHAIKGTRFEGHPVATGSAALGAASAATLLGGSRFAAGSVGHGLARPVGGVLAALAGINLALGGLLHQG